MRETAGCPGCAGRFVAGHAAIEIGLRVHGRVHAPLFAARRNWEKSLAKALPADEATSLSGYCAVCGRESSFRYDHQYAESGAVNWRERLLCAHCGLNNRQRLALHVLAAQMDRRHARIYATERTTPTARSLARLYPEVTLSEFLGPGWQGGGQGSSPPPSRPGRHPRRCWRSAHAFRRLFIRLAPAVMAARGGGEEELQFVTFCQACSAAGERWSMCFRNNASVHIC